MTKLNTVFFFNYVDLTFLEFACYMVGNI